MDFNEEDPGGAANAWNARWTEGAGPNLSPGEAAEITISLLALDPRLTAGEEFIIEIELPGQPPMELIRTTRTSSYLSWSLSRKASVNLLS